MKLIIFAFVILALSLILCCQSPAHTVIQFIEDNGIYKHPYRPAQFVCWDFAEAFQSDAKAAGYECAVVTLGWESSVRSHVINAMYIDGVLTWVDVTGGRNGEYGYQIMKPLEVGNEYHYKEIGGIELKTILTFVEYEW